MEQNNYAVGEQRERDTKGWSDSEANKLRSFPPTHLPTVTKSVRFWLQSGDDTPRKRRTIRLTRNTVPPSLSVFTTLVPSILSCTGQSTQYAIVHRVSADNPKSIEDIGPNSNLLRYGKDGVHPGASCQAVV